MSETEQERLLNTNNIGLEAEEIGHSIIRELDSQGNQIKSISIKLEGVDQNLLYSSRIIRSINRRISCDSFIKVLIIIVMFLIFIGLLIFKLS